MLCLVGAARTHSRLPGTPQSRSSPLMGSNGNRTSHAQLGPASHPSWTGTARRCRSGMGIEGPAGMHPSGGGGTCGGDGVGCGHSQQHATPVALSDVERAPPIIIKLSYPEYHVLHASLPSSLPMPGGLPVQGAALRSRANTMQKVPRQTASPPHLK